MFPKGILKDEKKYGGAKNFFLDCFVRERGDFSLISQTPVATNQVCNAQCKSNNPKWQWALMENSQCYCGQDIKYGLKNIIWLPLAIFKNTFTSNRPPVV